MHYGIRFRFIHEMKEFRITANISILIHSDTEDGATAKAITVLEQLNDVAFNSYEVIETVEIRE